MEPLTPDEVAFDNERKTILIMDNCRNKAKSLGIRIAVANDCFYLWFTPKQTDEKRNFYVGREIKLWMVPRSVSQLCDILDAIKLGMDIK